MQEGFGRLITSGKIMRKLPQEFGFSLSGKKQYSLDSEKYQGSNAARRPDSISILPGSSNSDSSPRAPCQDLDTINL